MGARSLVCSFVRPPFRRFRDSAIHDLVVTDGHRIGALRATIHHHSMRSFEDMKKKLDERAWLSVKYADPHSTAPLLPRLITEIPMNFFKYYIGRVHFTGGITGLRYASIQSWYRFLKIYRMQRARGSRSRFFAGWHRENEAAKTRDGLSAPNPVAAGTLEDQVQVDFIKSLPSVHPLDPLCPMRICAGREFAKHHLGSKPSRNYSGVTGLER